MEVVFKSLERRDPEIREKATANAEDAKDAKGREGRTGNGKRFNAKGREGRTGNNERILRQAQDSRCFRHAGHLSSDCAVEASFKARVHVLMGDIRYPFFKGEPMPTIKTKDGVDIFYKDWGTGQPIVFSHGWPLSADDWDNQMLFFLGLGYRVIAHDRRGHGRSTQVADGHDMDHYADDLAALTAHLDLKNAIHIGHSTGGGEVVRYLARHGESRVSKAALISAVPPLMVKTPANPLGLPKSVFDDLQAQLAASRAKFYRDLPEGPFYGYNRPGAKASEGVIGNWWRQGMIGGAKAHYDGIVAFSQTDFTEDLKKITVPVLVIHSEDDQIVPYVASGPLTAKLLKNGTLITYKDFPHGMPTTQAETINADLLKFLKG
jgi:non-heme chloroperoxidase